MQRYALRTRARTPFVAPFVTLTNLRFVRPQGGQGGNKTRFCSAKQSFAKGTGTGNKGGWGRVQGMRNCALQGVKRRHASQSERVLESIKFVRAKRLGSQMDTQLTARINLNIKMGDYVSCGDKIGELFDGPAQRFSLPVIIGESGKIIKISSTQIVLQRVQPILFYSEANVHVKRHEWVKRGAPILTLTHQTLITGDIVQGIPRIEQLFEAFTSPPPSTALEKEPVYETLHSQVRQIFRENWVKAPLPAAVRQSLEQIQQIIVESLQKVYLSQGVLIADKHIEIVVKQMTSKGQILDCGSTGLLLDEVLPLRQIENANHCTPGKKALYAPAVVGLTRSSLNSDSFISAASFQETTRVLSRDAVAGKSDFLRGLKEKVVIGDLISAGTGLDMLFIYPLLAEKLFNKKYKDFRLPGRLVSE